MNKVAVASVGWRVGWQGAGAKAGWSLSSFGNAASARATRRGAGEIVQQPPQVDKRRVWESHGFLPRTD
jgi:hypothetical protein